MKLTNWLMVVYRYHTDERECIHAQLMDLECKEMKDNAQKAKIKWTIIGMKT